jgi:outer membrane protein assembly factor BamB
MLSNHKKIDVDLLQKFPKTSIFIFRINDRAPMQTKILLPLLAVLFAGKLTYAQFPQIKWFFDTHDASYGQSAAADIDGDGKLEIVFGCYRNDSCVYALNAENGTLLWKFNTHPNGAEGCNDVAPVIYDVDGDDSLEVIVPSSCNPVTYCFRGSNGTVKWMTPTAGSDSPPTIGDIDNDGDLEILQGGFDGHVLCFDGKSGTIKWSLNVDENSWIQTAPTLVDLDTDGQLDFVVATWGFSGDTSKIYAFRGSDQSLLWKKPVSDVIYHGTAVSDLDHDGKPELVIGSYNGILYAINGEDGSDAWTYSYSSSSYYYIGAPASIADLDKDGNCEVIFVDMNIVGALTNTGHLIWKYTIPDYGTSFRGVAIADINGDELPDVAFGTSEGSVVTLNGTNGSLIWDYNLAAHYGNTFELDNAPLIADFNNDNTLEIFIVGGHGEYPNFQNDYGRGYMIAAGIGTGPEWLMFQHDIRRQSSLCNDSTVSVPQNEMKKAGEVNLYPNPSENEFFIERPVDCSDYLVEIINLNGELVKKVLLTSTATPVNIRDLARGFYFVRIINSGSILTKKLFKY